MNNKISRNDPCPCGSGKKYKKCCGVPINQSSEELLEHLSESLEFLIKSCLHYDEGDKSEAKRIAVEIRKLFHDTKYSKSILSSLKLKTIKFSNTSSGYFPLNLMTTHALTSVCMKNTVGQVEAEFEPYLDDVVSMRKSEFDMWWNEIIICDENKNTFSRRDIILFLANQDGGAHVDEDIEVNYYNLTRKHTIGWKVGGEINGIPIEEESIQFVHLATTRQIAHEVIRTLESEIYSLQGNRYLKQYNEKIIKSA